MNALLSTFEFDRSIAFDWAPYKDGHVTHERAALMIRMRDHISGRTFHFQLDTALSENLLYADAITENQHSFGTVPRSVGENTCIWEIELGHSPNEKRELTFTLQHGFDPNLEGDYPFPILGSLGLDFLGQIGFVLDYPEQRIFFLSENELNLLKADHPGVFHPFSYGDEKSMKQINFRLQLDDQEMTAIFDTASSMFELILPPKAWESHTQTTFLEAERQVAIPAWGKMINIYGQSCHSKALLAGKEFPISECFSWPDFSWKPIIGNKPFLENIVVFDLRYLAYAIF